MNALATTFSDFSRAMAGLSSPLRTERDGRIERLICDGQRIGWMGETTRDDPTMHFKWEAAGSYGFAATRGDCLAAVAKLIPEWREWQAADAAREAEIDAMPEPLRALRLALDDAKLRLEIERNRTVLRDDRLSAAEEAVAAATMAFDAAERAIAEAA